MTGPQSVVPVSLALTVSQVLATGRRRASAVLALLPVLMGPALAGCGQKGPLVLPPAAAAPAPAASVPSAAPAR